MQTIKHSAARLGLAATLAIGLTWGLSACGGGGGEDEPDFAVTAAVQGDTAPGTTLAAGQSATLSVPSGATLVFSSERETRWTPTPTDASFIVDSFSWTSKSFTVSSNGGGNVVIVFSNKDKPSEAATLTVQVEARRFEQVVPEVGVALHSTPQFTALNGSKFTKVWKDEVTSVAADGAYVEEHTVVDYSPTPISRNTFDAAGRQLTYEFDWLSDSPDVCTYAPALQVLSFPLYVGKSWANDSTANCTSNNLDRWVENRTVEAFERVSTPAGDFESLRIRAEGTFSDAKAPRREPFYTYSAVCWWSIELGRYVKCDTTKTYPDGTWEGNPHRELMVVNAITR